MSKIRKFHIDTVLLQFTVCRQILSVVPINVLDGYFPLSLGSSPGSCVPCIVSFTLEQLLSLSLCQPWHFKKTKGWLSVKCPFIWVCLAFFSWYVSEHHGKALGKETVLSAWRTHAHTHFSVCTHTQSSVPPGGDSHTHTAGLSIIGSFDHLRKMCLPNLSVVDYMVVPFVIDK